MFEFAARQLGVGNEALRAVDFGVLHFSADLRLSFAMPVIFEAGVTASLWLLNTALHLLP